MSATRSTLKNKKAFHYTINNNAEDETEKRSDSWYQQIYTIPRHKPNENFPKPSPQKSKTRPKGAKMALLYEEKYHVCE